MQKELAGVLQFDTDKLKSILADNSWEVIDVRTDEEYEAGHIPNVPLKTMQNVGSWMHELEKNQAYVFVCRSGSRSQRVAEFLRQHDFSKVANFSGGMLTWDDAVKQGMNP